MIFSPLNAALVCVNVYLSFFVTFTLFPSLPHLSLSLSPSSLSLPPSHYIRAVAEHNGRDEGPTGRLDVIKGIGELGVIV